MEPTLSAINYQRSVKKHFVDSLKTAHGINLKFGPNFSNVDEAWTEWVAISIGRAKIGGLSTAILNIFPCVRSSSSGGEKRLPELVDLIFENLTNYDDPDGFSVLSIPLYNTLDDPWTVLCGIMIAPNPERGEPMEAEDGTLFQMLVVTTNFFTR